MLKIPTLTPEFWVVRVGQAVSWALGFAASFGLNLTNVQKAAVLSVTVAFIPGLLEIGWLHFRGLINSVVPASPTHVIVATPTAVATDTSATVSAKVGTGESVTVSHTAAGTTTAAS